MLSQDDALVMPHQHQLYRCLNPMSPIPFTAGQAEEFTGLLCISLLAATFWKRLGCSSLRAQT